MNKTLIGCVLALIGTSSFFVSCKKEMSSPLRYETNYVFNLEISGYDTLDREKAPLLTRLADTVKILTVQTQEIIYGQKAPSSRTPFAKIARYVGYGQTQDEAQENAHISATEDNEAIKALVATEGEALMNKIIEIRDEYAADIAKYSKKYKLEYLFKYKFSLHSEVIDSLVIGTLQASGTALPSEEPLPEPEASK